MRALAVVGLLAIVPSGCDRDVPTDPVQTEAEAPPSSDKPWATGGGGGVVCPPGVTCFRATGIVRDAYTQAPIPNAIVTVASDPSSPRDFHHAFYPGPDGTYDTGFIIPTLQYSVSVSAPGFVSAMFPGGGWHDMVATDASVGGIRGNGLYERARFSGGICSTRGGIVARVIRVYRRGTIDIEPPVKELFPSPHAADLAWFVSGLAPGVYDVVGDTIASGVGLFRHLDVTVASGRSSNALLLHRLCSP